MSSAYTSQPATKGKVIISTSGGDLEIELWPKECPKACRNFIQLCMEGYYDDTPIHRIIPKFIVQCGDPTGTGTGGQSIYGAPFQDEFHSRLKFVQRGLLAMANTGPNTNNSQFFFTLGPTPALNGKNTIFGKVVGNTVFNLLKLGELETDKDDRPIFNAKIVSTEIVSNPFDDIVPRITREEKIAQKKLEEQMRLEREKASQPAGKKNLTLLSFADDASHDIKGPKAKIKSIHDMLGGGDSSQLSSKMAPESAKPPTSFKDVFEAHESKKRKEISDDDDEKEDKDFDKKMRAKVAKQNSVAAPKLDSKAALEEEIQRLRGEIKQIGAQKKQEEVVVKREKGAVARMRNQYLNSGKAVPALRKDTKNDVEAKLKGFESTLKQSWKSSNDLQKKKAKASEVVAPLKDEEEWECSLHFIKNCSSCRDTFGEQESDDDEGWMNASLKFEKEVGANVFKPKVDDYSVIDPRKGAKADPFGRDIQILGDIKSKQKALGIWEDRSTRKVKSAVDQAAEAPDNMRYQ